MHLVVPSIAPESSRRASANDKRVGTGVVLVIQEQSHAASVNGRLLS